MLRLPRNLNLAKVRASVPMVPARARPEPVLSPSRAPSPSDAAAGSFQPAGEAKTRRGLHFLQVSIPPPHVYARFVACIHSFFISSLRRATFQLVSVTRKCPSKLPVIIIYIYLKKVVFVNGLCDRRCTTAGHLPPYESPNSALNHLNAAASRISAVAIEHSFAVAAWQRFSAALWLQQKLATVAQQIVCTGVHLAFSGCPCC